MRNPKSTAAGAAALALALTAGPVASSSGASPSSASPSPGAAGAGDPLFPGLGNGGYDVTSYDLDLTYLAGTRTLRGKAGLAARATQALSRFNLDAAGLDVSNVNVNGVPAAFALRGEELVVTPEVALPRGLDFSVSVRYTADPRPSATRPAGGLVATGEGFAIEPAPGAAHTVFPCNDHPSDKATLNVRITAPAGLVGVAGGLSDGTTLNHDGTTSSMFRMRQPVATSRVALAVGPYTMLDRGLHGTVEWRDVVPTLQAPGMLPALSLTADQVIWAQDRLGEFPLDAYGILVAGGAPATGLAPQTLTVYRPDFLAQPEDRIGGQMMGGLVQSWFGSSVTPRDWSAQWLVGGHASLYSEMYRFDRGWADEHGHRTLDERMRALYAQGDAWRARSGAVARPSTTGLFDAQRREGAGLALYALLTKVGPEIFTKIERVFLAQYRDRSASTEDYIAVAEKAAADPTVRPFLESWLYGKRTPAMPGNPGWKADRAPAAR